MVVRSKKPVREQTGIQVVSQVLRGWAMVIAWELLGTKDDEPPMRFGELKKRLAPINQKVLSANLQHLVENGVVEAVDPGYRLTRRGEALGPMLLMAARWGENHQAALTVGNHG